MYIYTFVCACVCVGVCVCCACVQVGSLFDYNTAVPAQSNHRQKPGNLALQLRHDKSCVHGPSIYVNSI